jgi:hypothetical protein
MTPGAQVTPDQGQQPFVADLPGHSHHQHVVLNSVEKFRQIHVDALPITGANVGLYLLRCSLGGAAWSKAETRLRESGVEDRREDLQNGLLEHAIDHVGNSEISRAAIRFGNRLTPGRARSVSPFQELPPDLGPLRPEGFRELVQGDAIGAGGSAVRPDVLPSRFEIGLVDNPFH